MGAGDAADGLTNGASRRELYDEFLARYRALLISELPEERPYPFTFKRILLWGRA